MKKFSLRLVWQALKDSFKGFGDDKIAKLSASLSYYTVFSLGPLLIVIISLCAFFVGQQEAQGTVYNQIKNFIGEDTARQVQEIINNASLSGKGGVAATIGVITLLIGATTVFGEIQDSINSIWGLKPRPKLGLMKLLITRLLSFGLVVSLGFLLLVSLGVTAIIEAVGNRLMASFPNVAVVVFYIINLILTLAVTTVLFAVVFKVLPDAKFRWKDIWPGAIATTLLFLIGKFGISFYVSQSQIGSTYGAAGSLVILLVWVYYSAIILYFGAEFTKAYAFRKGARIIPNKFAEWSDEKTVTGAKPKSQQPTPGFQQGGPDWPQRMPQPAYAPQRFVHPIRQPAPKKSGMGTVLVGLALYLFKRDKRQGG